MLKISVALLLIALAINASAKPWPHQARSFVTIQSGDIETNEVGDTSDSDENEVAVDDYYDDDYEDDDEPEDSDNDEEEILQNKRIFENLKQELMNKSDHVFRKKIEEIFSKHPEPDFSDLDNVNEVFKKILNDVHEYMESIGLTMSNEEEGSKVTTEKPQEPENGSHEGSDESDPSDRKNLLKYVFKSLTQDLVNSADPEFRDDVQEIINKYGEPDFSDGDEVEELYQKILKEVKAFLKSKGVATSSEEQDTSSEEGSCSSHSTTEASVEEPESTEGSDEGGVETNDVTTEEPEENNPSDRKNLLKYVFKSLTQDLVNSADPEFRDDVQEIVNKYGEPDFSDGDEVEELYQKILKEVKAFLKSKGIATSSEEQGTSSEEGSGSSHSTTEASVEEPESSEESEENNPSDRKNLLKYVFKSLTQDLVNSADPEFHDDVQEIVNKYGEPDFSDGDEVEELYQKILKEVKAFLKSKGVATSSEEQGTSSEEGSGANHSTTEASVEEPESTEGSDESVETNDVATEEPEESQESGSSEESEESNEGPDSIGRKKELLKYVFQSLTQDLIDSADPEIRDEVQNIINKHGEPDYVDGDKVEEHFQKILKDVKDYKKSKGLETSSEEENSEEGSSSNLGTTAAPAQDSDEGHDSDESHDSDEESEDEGNDIDSDEDDSNDISTQLMKYVFQTLKEDILEKNPEIRDKIQEIFDKYGEPDYSDADKVEETYQKILKDIKDYKKSKGLPTSSEEQDSSAEGTVTISTAAPVQTPDSDEEGESAEVGVETLTTAKPNQEQGHDSSEEDDSDEEDSDDRKTQLYKYVFKALKKDLLNNADPETRAKIQEIFENHPVDDFSDGERVEQIYKKILEDVKEYKKSKGLTTSSEEDDV